MSDLWVGVIGSLVGACAGGSIAIAITRYQVRRQSESQKVVFVEVAAMKAASDLQSILHDTIGAFMAFGHAGFGSAVYLDKVEACLRAESGLLSLAHKHVWINAHLFGPEFVESFYEIFERYEAWERVARVALAGEWRQTTSDAVAVSLAGDLRDRMRGMAELVRGFAIRNVTPNPRGDLARSLARWNRPERL